MNTNTRSNKWAGRKLNDILASLAKGWTRKDSRMYFQERENVLANLPECV